MINELNQAITTYITQWDALANARKDKSFFAGLRPTAVGWKVADRAEYNKLYAELHDDCDLIVETWINGRWVAKLHLRGAKLAGGIEILKLMERRPASTDAIGLDHLDFYGPDLARVEQVLQTETDLKWTHESNDAVENYDWISVWFAGTEAKLKADTVLDIVTVELQAINKKITAGK